MLNKTKAVVLHHVKYGEYSIIATLYTEKYGRIACMVNGVRSKKAKIPATLFQPLSLLEADFYYRQNREVQRLKEATCPYYYHSIPFDISKSTVALFLAEVLFLSLREEESNPVLFTFLFHALQLLDTMEHGISVFHPWFMIHLTRFLGFFPQQIINDTHIFTADTEVFQTLSPGALSALRLITSNYQGPPDLSAFTTNDRNELLERIIRFYTNHIDGFHRLKSFTVLREVFNQR